MGILVRAKMQRYRVFRLHITSTTPSLGFRISNKPRYAQLSAGTIKSGIERLYFTSFKVTGELKALVYQGIITNVLILCLVQIQQIAKKNL